MTDKLTTCITAFVWTPASIFVTNNIIPYTHTHTHTHTQAYVGIRHTL